MSEIAKRQIDIFTSSKNVSMQVVERITERMKLLKNYKPNAKMLAAGFNVDRVTYYEEDVNIDTIMYMVDMYGFTKEIEGWGNYIMIVARYRADNGYIRMKSENIEVNLLPNDIKQKVLIG